MQTAAQPGNGRTWRDTRQQSTSCFAIQLYARARTCRVLYNYFNKLREVAFACTFWGTNTEWQIANLDSSRPLCPSNLCSCAQDGRFLKRGPFLRLTAQDGKILRRDKLGAFKLHHSTNEVSMTQLL